jgi:hypothetical protein
VLPFSFNVEIIQLEFGLLIDLSFRHG